MKTEFAKRGNVGNELESCVTGAATGAAAFEVGGVVGVGVGVGVEVPDVPWW
ncbi:MAG TPA: hypothetical protein VGZ00_11405 [Candidatus Baltobacteraceae bacterium]|nr:hypothetical protein [Candidatus Baltobacteraceae bacterium]